MLFRIMVESTSQYFGEENQIESATYSFGSGVMDLISTLIGAPLPEVVARGTVGVHPHAASEILVLPPSFPTRFNAIFRIDELMVDV